MIKRIKEKAPINGALFLILILIVY